MKRIAVIYGGSKDEGGVNTYLTNLFKYADKNKVSLELISLGSWPLVKRFQASGFRYQVFPGGWRNLLNIIRVSGYLKKNNFGLIVSQGLVANFYARKTSVITKIPNLVTVHSDWCYDYSGFKKLFYFVLDRLLRFATSRYVTVSCYLRDRLIEEGIKSGKITVIYNGVTCSVISTGMEKSLTKERDLSASARDDKCLIIGTMGRLHPVKNYGELIKAFGLILKEHPNSRLEIAGEGAERKNLEMLITKLGLNEKVKLLGRVENIENLFEKWDVYVQPSISEGFGLGVVEAMLFGLPVVVTPGGALSELVEDGKTGFLAKGFSQKEVFEAIKQALRDKEKMQQVAKAGQKFAQEKFNVSAWIEKTVSAYLEAVK